MGYVIFPITHCIKCFKYSLLICSITSLISEAVIVNELVIELGRI